MRPFTTLMTLATLAVATPALALVPINEEPYINNVLLQGFIGDAIDDNCDTIEARKLRALGELNKLRDYALEQGYEMGRPSDLHLEADVAGGNLKAVRVAGQAVQIMSGVLEL